MSTITFEIQGNTVTVDTTNGIKVTMTEDRIPNSSNQLEYVSEGFCTSFEGKQITVFNRRLTERDGGLLGKPIQALGNSTYKNEINRITGVNTYEAFDARMRAGTLNAYHASVNEMLEYMALVQGHFGGQPPKLYDDYDAYALKQVVDYQITVNDTVYDEETPDLVATPASITSSVTAPLGTNLVMSLQDIETNETVMDFASTLEDVPPGGYRLIVMDMSQPNEQGLGFLQYPRLITVK